MPAAATSRAKRGHVRRLNPPVDISEKIQQIIQHEDYGQYGLRKGGRMKVGRIAPKSRRWQDNELTKEKLDGTSVLAVRSYNVQDKLSRLSGYPGSFGALLGGNYATEGEDPGEIVIENAKVLYVWKDKKNNPRGARPGKYTAKDLVGIGKSAVQAKLAPWTLLNKGKKKNRKNTHNEGAAVEAYKSFHGRSPEELIEFDTVHHFPGRTAAIGDLVALSIRVPQERFPSDTARERTVDLSDFGDAWLTEHPTMKQLYVEGGDQSVDLEQFGLDEGEPHELEYLGDLVRCVYFTRKDHLGSEGGEANYHHKFGKNELTLKKTELIKVAYHVPDEQLIFAGGGYEIPAEGIDG